MQREIVIVTRNYYIGACRYEKYVAAFNSIGQEWVYILDNGKKVVLEWFFHAVT